jgi:hypothetical protein
MGIEVKRQRVKGRTFELLFGVEINLLSLGDLFQNILDDDPVVDSHITIASKSEMSGSAQLRR